jgi:hypothetical protein
MIVLPARQPSAGIAHCDRFTSRAQAAALRVQHLDMDCLHPTTQGPALHWQALANILHLSAKGELSGVDAIELRGDDFYGFLKG